MNRKTILVLALSSVAIIPMVLLLPGRDLSDVAAPVQPRTDGGSQNAPIARPPDVIPILPKPEITNSIPRVTPQRDVADLRRGLDRLTSRDVENAISIRDQMPKSDPDRQILTWAIAISGQSTIASGELQQTLLSLGNFPGQVTIRSSFERATIREQATPEKIISIFDAESPITIEGKIAFAQALSANGRNDEASEIITELWKTEILTKAHESAVKLNFTDLLTLELQRDRFFMLAYRGRMKEAGELADIAQVKSLFAAWNAVAQRSKNAASLLKSAAAEWSKHPAHLYLSVRLNRQLSKYADAAKLLEAISLQEIEENAPSAWWNEMRVIARGLLDLGHTKRAYQLIASHPKLDGAEAVDAEFHAGWLALRFNRQASQAETHFQKMRAASTTAINIAKSHYWLARAIETGSPDKALEHYRLAAQHSASFYGQLAAAKLGQKLSNVETPKITDEDRILLAGNPLMQAINRLEQAGYSWRADILYRSLASELDRPGELALLTNRLEARGAHQVSLQVGKTAFSRGIDHTALAFPMSAIPASAEIGETGKALAFAIARQESAFDVAAISPANAQGLLQILPGTAKDVANRLNLEFTPSRLTSDAAYNATLGAQYLSEQISRFNGSYILTFIAYNAGPRRVDEWTKRYGDPRKQPLEDVIDWIERIPYPETRNYVQRVMENYQVYKARLGQEADIVSDLTQGRQS